MKQNDGRAECSRLSAVINGLESQFDTISHQKHINTIVLVIRMNMVRKKTSVTVLLQFTMSIMTFCGSKSSSQKRSVAFPSKPRHS